MKCANGKLRVLLAATALTWSGVAFPQGRISSLEALDKIQPNVTTAPQVHELRKVREISRTAPSHP